MLYAIIAQDLPDSLAKRKLARPAHLERLEALRAENRLLLAGPHPINDPARDPARNPANPGEAGFTGSLIVAEFDSLDDARAWADADPYVAAGVYADVMVKPFMKVLP